jgi:hypothetical protein
LASAVGILVAFGTPMFFVYGTMLDTLQTSLPFAVGFLIVWSDRDDDPGRAAWPVVVLAAVTVLASWEGALLVAVATAVDLVVAGRRRRQLGIPPEGRGLLTGAVLLVTWLLWAEGSLGPIVEQFQVRSGGTGSAPGLGEFLSSQRVFFDRTYSPFLALIGVAGLVLAIRSVRLRRLAITVTVVVVAYPLALHDAAFHHDYWNYWFLLAFAIGATALVQAGLDLAARHGDGHLAGPTAVGCVVLAVVLGLTGATRDTVSVEQQVTGRQAGAIARAGGSHLAFLVGNELPPADWFTYYTGNSYRRLDTPRSIQLAAQRAPDADVLLRCGYETPWLLRACARFGLRIGQYRAVPLRSLERVVT